MRKLNHWMISVPHGRTSHLILNRFAYLFALVMICATTALLLLTLLSTPIGIRIATSQIQEDKSIQLQSTREQLEPNYLNQILKALSNMTNKLNEMYEELADTAQKHTLLSTELETLKNNQLKMEQDSNNQKAILQYFGTALNQMTSSISVLNSNPKETVGMTNQLDLTAVLDETPFVVDATKLPQEYGKITFDGNMMPLRPRKFWVFEKAGTMKFTLDSNELKPDTHLAIVGFDRVAQLTDEVYFNSTSFNGTEVYVSGVTILIMMVRNLPPKGDPGPHSSFSLQFNHKRNDNALPPGRVIYPTTIVSDEGKYVVNFPVNNPGSYVYNANHLTILSPASGRRYSFIIKSVDIDHAGDISRWWCVQQNSNKTWFDYKGGLAWNERKINMGACQTWVGFFHSDEYKNGKGYSFEITSVT